MRISIGVIVAICTVVGSILIGGANFGEVRGSVDEQSRRIDSLDTRMITIEEHIREISIRTVKMDTNLEWIKEALDNKGGD